MSAEVHWAYPDVRECYAFRGRLYRTLTKAQVEQRRYAKYVAEYGVTSQYWRDFDLTIHRIDMEWESL